MKEEVNFEKSIELHGKKFEHKKQFIEELVEGITWYVRSIADEYDEKFFNKVCEEVCVFTVDLFVGLSVTQFEGRGKKDINVILGGIRRIVRDAADEDSRSGNA